MAFLFCSPAHLVKRYAAKVLVQFASGNKQNHAPKRVISETLLLFSTLFSVCNEFRATHCTYVLPDGNNLSL